MKRMLLIIIIFLLVLVSVGLAVYFFVNKEKNSQVNVNLLVKEVDSSVFFPNSLKKSLNIASNDGKFIWSSFYFQPFIVDIEEKDNNKFLLVEYKNEIGTVMNTRVSLDSEIADGENKLFIYKDFADFREDFFKTPKDITNKSDLEKYIKKGNQVTIIYLSEFPNVEELTTEVCDEMRKGYMIDFCAMSKRIINENSEQISFQQSQILNDSKALIPLLILTDFKNE